jgi:predicted lipoprotein with Yx(FWY)xxD motif
MQSLDLLRVLALPLVVAAACSDDTANPGPDAGGGSGSGSATADLTLSAASGNIGPHLVSKDGKTLYFYVPDLAGSGASTCGTTGDCITKWPAYDVQNPTLGTGLTATDFGRFDRGGGVFQATFKGRPLYTYAADATGTTGEAKGGIWFVARPYNVFFGLNKDDATKKVTPLGGTASGPFLTNGAGQALYVFKNDTPATGGGTPTSGCLAMACYDAWPVWEKKTAAGTAPVVPSTLNAADFSDFTNPGVTNDTTRPAKLQFVYKGYPLYFFTQDFDKTTATPTPIIGSVKGDGANNGTWHAISGGFTPPVT